MYKYLFLFFLLSINFLSAQSTQKINPKDITIARDQWGVPHVYGKTDADAVYGMSWAHAEDDFETMQHALLATRFRLAEVLGKNGAVLDVIAFSLNPDHIVDTYWESSFSPEFRKILAAHAQAINDYAEQHPKEILRKKLFPISEKDIVKGYVLAQSLMVKVAFDVGRLFSNKLDPYKPSSMGIMGSNGMAFNSGKTKDKKIYLVSNTHLPLEGIIGWYEVHVNSEEGWNFLGATMSAGITPFLGTNENLGWTHTVNFPDFCDVYKLKMHPDNKNMYSYQGEWFELEKRVVKLKVKVGFLRIPVKKKFYWSEFGPVIKNKSGYFAIRYGGLFNIKAAEQWYRMTKANSFEEFRDVLDIQGLVGQNIIYADRKDNIFFLSNGLFPYRDPEYNWKGILEGEKNNTIWDENKYYPVADLPQVLNPKCGYLFNMNNSPFNATCPGENEEASSVDPHIGFSLKESNRSLRFQELIDQYVEVNMEDIKKIKYDQQYHSESFYTFSIENLDDIFNMDPTEYPDLQDVMEIGQRWNKQADIDNKQATVFAVAITRVLKYMGDELLIDQSSVIDKQVFVDALRWAKKYLKKHYGTLEVELGKVQKHMKGDVELPMGGMPEVLMAMNYEKHKKGKLKAVAGETYIQFVRYGENGAEVIESVHPFGASNHSDSPHYTDQMKLYVNQELKKMTLDKEKIMKEAKRIYHPGE